MKKTTILQIMIFLTITLCSCESCKKEYLTELPPETQTGANTFGCYANGKLFVKGEPIRFGEPSLYAVYSKELRSISLYAVNKNIGRMAFYKYLNCANTNYQIDDFYTGDVFTPLSCVDIVMYNDYYSCFTPNEFVITKFDTINNIVSGRFNFILKSTNRDNINDSIIITEGRFDIPIDINN
jgi:hypothetical protein